MFASYPISTIRNAQRRMIKFAIAFALASHASRADEIKVVTPVEPEMKKFEYSSPAPTIRLDSEEVTIELPTMAPPAKSQPSPDGRCTSLTPAQRAQTPGC
jgi:hypothetical protein